MTIIIMVKVIKVKKRSGRLQRFNKMKIYKSCKRAGASAKVSRTVMNSVSKRVKNRMSTSKIRKMVLRELGKRSKKSVLEFRKFRKRRR